MDRVLSVNGIETAQELAAFDLIAFMEFGSSRHGLYAISGRSGDAAGV